MTLEIIQIAVDTGLDNYNYIVRESASGVTAAVDPSFAEPVLEILEKKNWQLNYILSTHHHHDHVGGNVPLKQATGCKVIGYAGDATRIPGIDYSLQAGQKFVMGHALLEVLFVPGHTLGHIAYHFPQDKALFCGDTVFSLGCGRLFEGTPLQMLQSFQKIMALPEDTKLYCAHEYTQSNGRFALTVEPENHALLARMEEVRALREEGKPTVPSTLGEERATNPFMRTGSADIRNHLHLHEATDVEVFAALRKRKDQF